MATIVSTRINRLQAVSPRTQTVGLGLGMTTSWAEVQTRPANLAALSGSEALKNSDITIGADGRIAGIGTGALKQVDNAGISLSSSGQLTYSTPGGPVNIGSVLLSGLGAGNFAYLSALNSSNIGSYIAASAIGSYYISDLAASKLTAGTLAAGVVYAGTVAANKVTAGTLAADVVYAGTISADKINSGTFSGASIAITSSAGGWLFNAGLNGTTVSYRKLSGYNISAGNLADPASPAVLGASMSGSTGVGVYGSSVNSGHGVRGSSGTGTAGLIGTNVGFDFYAEGSGANYGPFTGAHDALILNSDTVEPGDIVVDVVCVARRGWSSTLFEVTRSTTANQPAVVGVVALLGGGLAGRYPPAVYNAPIVTIDDYGNAITLMDADYEAVKDTHSVIAANALGEGQMNVCGEGGNLEPGDLIVTSSRPGKGMKQADDILRGYTVAKCREAVTFESPTQVKQVACIYLCG